MESCDEDCNYRCVKAILTIMILFLFFSSAYLFYKNRQYKQKIQNPNPEENNNDDDF